GGTHHALPGRHGPLALRPRHLRRGRVPGGDRARTGGRATMKQLLPYPVLFLVLFLVWMVLGEAITPGRAVLGLVAAAAGTRLMRSLRLDEPSLRRPAAALRLAVAVSIDIVRSNIAVARIIGRPGREI